MNTKISIFECLSRPIETKVKKSMSMKAYRKLLRRQESKRKYANRIPKKYKVYIKSKWWEKRKNLYFQSHEKKCAICSSSEHIQLHHMVYKNYGNEKDEHLVPLCREHHNLFHSQTGTHTNMVKDTNDFIIETSEIESFPKV